MSCKSGDVSPHFKARCACEINSVTWLPFCSRVPRL
jgi:hypothetical protein